jgi:hypothetical protein
MRVPRWLTFSLLFVTCATGGYLLVRTADVPSQVAKPKPVAKPVKVADAYAPALNSGERAAPALRHDDEAMAAGAIAGQRFIVFADQAAMERFLAKTKGKAIAILGRLNELNALRVGFLSADDLAGLLDGSEKKGFLFPVLVPDLPQGTVQAGALGFGDGLLSWLGVANYDRALWGSGVTVAVLDTGVSALAGLSGLRQINLVDLPADPSALNGHGSAVAALIQQVAPDAKVLSIRIADDLGSSNSWLLSQGILQAVASGASVINISMGSYGDSEIVQKAIAYAQAHGSVVVASSGNEGLAQTAYPAAYAGVVAVGAVDARGDHLLFSNSGSNLSLSAPGYGLYSAGADGETISFSGTSASAPVASGVIAATMSNGVTSNLSASDAATMVMSQLDESGAPGTDPQYGGGAIDLGRVLQRDTAGIVDAAVASHWVNKSGSLQVTVQNEGTTPIYNASVDVSTALGTTSISVGSLAPGKTQTFTVPAPSSQEPTTFQSNIQLSGGQIDRNPGNNRRTDVYTPGEVP